MKITKEQVEKNKTRILRLLESTKRPGIDRLVGWLEGTDFFTAPASTRLDFHGAHEGGLALNSLNVYDALEVKAKTYDLGIRSDERIVSALAHDFCKISVYQQNVLKNGKLSDSKPYVMKDDFPFGHGEKSALLTAKYLDLTRNEALLIRWHMGDYDREWENYREKVSNLCPAILAFHCADHEAARYMDYRLVKGMVVEE
ncbi:MAG: metal-dependent phosphohydrolase [Nanoarchaeota archaeon]